MEEEITGKISTVCLFCCKTVENSKCSSLNREKGPDYLFFGFLERYLGTGSTFTNIRAKVKDLVKDINETGNLVCPDCEGLTKNICDLYHHLKCTELQIQHKIDTLICVMKQANRVSSRMSKVKQHIGNSEQIKNFLEVRREFQRKCYLRLSQCIPRVRVQKTASSESINSPATLETVAVEPIHENRLNTHIAWLQFAGILAFHLLESDNDHINMFPKYTNLKHNDSNRDSIDYEEEFEHFDLCQDTDNQEEEHDSVEQKVVLSASYETVRNQKDIMEVGDVANSNSSDKLNLENNSPECANFPCKQEPNEDEHEVEQPSKKKFKTKLKRVTISTKYMCKLCCQSFSNYALYLSHRKSTCHNRRLNRKFEFINDESLSVTHLHDTESGSDDPSQKRQETSRYQLRSRSSKPTGFNTFQSGDLSSCESSGEDDDDAVSVVSAASFSSATSSSESNCSDDDAESKTAKLNNRRFKCKVKGCKYAAKRKLLLTMHQKIHVPGKYSCAFCDKTRLTAFSLAIHEKRKHSKKPKSKSSTKSKEQRSRAIPCARCPFKALQLNKYLHHFAAAHLKIPWIKSQRCSICKIPVDQRLAKQHFRYYHDTTNVHPSKILMCKENGCSAYFAKAYGLRLHKSKILHNMKLGDQSYECALCQQSFENLIMLNAHKELNHKTLENYDQPVFKLGAEGILICTHTHCSQLLESVEDLRVHVKLHGTFKCQFCETTKAYAPDLSIHEVSHDTAKFKLWKYSCQRCSYKSNIKSGYISHHLESHLRISDKLPCKICGLNKSGNLKHTTLYHGVVQTAKNSVKKCDQCPAYFLRDYQLAFHKQRQHMPEYKCKFGDCRATFRFELQLQHHENLHENLPCKFCGKMIDFVEDLALHELEHASENNQVSTNTIKCARCLQGFANVKVYVAHFVKMHCFIAPEYFRCNICQLVTDSSEKVKIHRKFCHGNLTSDSSIAKRCDICPAYFTSKAWVNNHRNKMHRNPTMCKICKIKFTTVESRQNHDKLHGSFSCQVCNIEKKHAKDLAIHELLQHGRVKENSVEKCLYLFTCHRCVHPPFPRLQVYVTHFIEQHLKLHTKVDACDVCQLECKNKNLLSRHKKLFHDVEGLEPNQIINCSGCSAYFRNQIQLNTHKLKVHKKGSSFMCKVCCKTFGSDKRLIEHKPAHDPPDTWRFLCPAKTCTEKFPSRDMLQAHMRAHSKNEYEFVCDVPNCGKRCPSEQNLESHKKWFVSKAHYEASGTNVSIETWKKELVICDICGLELTRGRISAHITRMHVKVRPTNREFKCDKCDKSFKLKAQLQTHQEFHKGPEEWKWMCAVCSKRCVTKQKLEEHMRTHTKEKPFVCQICGEKYAHRHNLRNHVNSKHKDSGEQDIPRPINHRNFVSRKGKKLKSEFCFTREQDQQK